MTFGSLKGCFISLLLERMFKSAQSVRKNWLDLVRAIVFINIRNAFSCHGVEMDNLYSEFILFFKISRIAKVSLEANFYLKKKKKTSFESLQSAKEQNFHSVRRGVRSFGSFPKMARVRSERSTRDETRSLAKAAELSARKRRFLAK